MKVEFKRLYSSKLVEEIEKERRHKIRETLKQPAFESLHTDILIGLEEYTKAEAAKRYCQIQINKRWNDIFQEFRKNHILDEQGRYEEMTIPEMMSDTSWWSDEDHKVYSAIMAAKKERLEALRNEAE